ncbi:MAG: TetR/AcrR family transcriptional regulator [Bacteroidetes bacterium]|nr:MAG: TetR/AcrR family transcriptional regulator [Bacteroidota bacterium]
MGIQERRQREISAQIASILQAARNLARRDGWPKVSIRKIAAAIEYTPPVIYEHFASRDAILVELEKRGFELLKGKLERAAEAEPAPEKQLMSLSLAYWRFALNDSDLYQLMFNLEGNKSSVYSLQSLREAGQPVADCLRRLNPFPTEADPLFFNWWALVHGFVSLYMSGQVPVSQVKFEQHYEAAIRRFLKAVN